MSEGGDVLCEIRAVQLPQLAALYEERAPWAPYMVSFVHTAMKWKQSEKFRDSITFWSPNDTWKSDGTIVANISFCSQDVFVFTLDDDGSSLYRALMETNRIKYDDRRTMFFAVHEKHMSAIQQFIKDKNLVKEMDNPCFLYAIPPEQARQFTVECPPEVFVRKLEPSAAQQVSAAWPHNFPGSDSYLGKFIEANGGYGVFLKSNNEMVAWVLKHAFGHPAMLQTEEKHMKKGYGSLVTRVLSKEIAEEGHWPVCSVMLNNERSKRMFEKLGFRSIGTCVFISLKHSKN